MGFVHVLDDRVRELISAGEVVERPSSVVKELVENALDAGADRIDVELRNHGLSLISVTDNGKGIEPDDIKTAFLRHATSKIAVADDLNAIGSLGFRGEALAAIAAVSKVRMTTKTPENISGYRYVIEGGKEVSYEECGAPTGTNVSVSDLFYNTPARMKFLKKDVAEGNACEQLLWHMALSYPDVSFRLIREGKLSLKTTGQGLYSAIFDLFPRESAASMGEISFSGDGVEVSGYVSAPTHSRASRSLQHISVNNRYVKSRAIQSAAEEAYRGFIMQGKFPAFVLNINVPLDAVDVNVHPAKTEIRFTDERAVTRSVYRAVKEAVQGMGTRTAEFSIAVSGETADEKTEKKPEPVSSVAEPRVEYKAQSAAEPEHVSAQNGLKPDPVKRIYDTLVEIDDGSYEKPSRPETGRKRGGLDIFWEESSAQKKEMTVPEISENTAADQIPADETPVQNVIEETQDTLPVQEDLAPQTSPVKMTVLGELFMTYIVAQAGDNLVLIDMHAAHERILYELIRAEHTAVSSQILLEPVIVSLSAEEKQAIVDNSSALERLGFSVSEIGNKEVAVREIPTYLSLKGVTDAILEIAQGLINNREDLSFEARDWLMHSSACRAAIKAGHKCSSEEMVSLAEKILGGDIPKFCPHGRPVYFTMDKKEIEKRFGRIV